MTLLAELAMTKDPALLALINPYRNPGNNAAPAAGGVGKHQTAGFGKSAFRKTHWDKKGWHRPADNGNTKRDC
ncbi:MAG: hypothetical protein ACRDRU_16350 [Pseudonocardiaceae bacterium]